MIGLITTPIKLAVALSVNHAQQSSYESTLLDMGNLLVPSLDAIGAVLSRGLELELLESVPVNNALDVLTKYSAKVRQLLAEQFGVGVQDLDSHLNTMKAKVADKFSEKLIPQIGMSGPGNMGDSVMNVVDMGLSLNPLIDISNNVASVVHAQEDSSRPLLEWVAGGFEVSLRGDATSCHVTKYGHWVGKSKLLRYFVRGFCLTSAFNYQGTSYIGQANPLKSSLDMSEGFVRILQEETGSMPDDHPVKQWVAALVKLHQVTQDICFAAPMRKIFHQEVIVCDMWNNKELCECDHTALGCDTPWDITPVACCDLSLGDSRGRNLQTRLDSGAGCFSPLRVDERLVGSQQQVSAGYGMGYFNRKGACR